MVARYKIKTLTEFIIERQAEYPQAKGSLTRLLNDIGTAAKIVNREINAAGLVDILGSVGTQNVQGETQKKLDVFANEMFVTMLGNFQDGTTPGKIQYGAAWWFLDQKSGMEKHLRDLSVLGLTARFVGMVTDSRSFLSFPRHEYFRRILCNYLGNEVDQGLIPNDQELLKTVIQDICYNNSLDYFGF